MFGGIFFLSEIDTLKYAIYVLLRLYSLEKKYFVTTNYLALC